MTPSLFAAVCAAATGAMVWTEWSGAVVARGVFKTIAAGCFVGAAFTAGAWQAGPPGRWVVGALLLCTVGDLCLISSQKSWFLAGLVAFLVGHLGFVGAFLALGVAPGPCAVAAVALAAVAYGIWRWLAPHVGGLARPVQAYIVVITAMVACAVGMVAVEPTAGRLVLFAAAVSFFLSDICVARQRFVVQGPINPTIGLPLYFGAQIAFALAIVPAVG